MALGWPRGDVDNELDPTFSLFLGMTVLGYLPPSSFVQDRYPGLQVEGGNFPPPPMRAMIAQALSALKFVFIIVLISGQNHEIMNSGIDCRHNIFPKFAKIAK